MVQTLIYHSQEFDFDLMLPTKLSRIQKVIKKCKKSSSNSVDFVHAAKTPILRFPLMAAHLWKTHLWLVLFVWQGGSRTDNS